jgi:hypothetical protein
MIFGPLRTKGLNALCVFESQSCITGSSPEQAFSQQMLRTHEKHTSQNESRTAKNEPRREVKPNSKERPQLRRRHERPYLLREQNRVPTTKRTSLSSTTNEHARHSSANESRPRRLFWTVRLANVNIRNGQMKELSTKRDIPKHRPQTAQPNSSRKTTARPRNLLIPHEECAASKLKGTQTV